MQYEIEVDGRIRRVAVHRSGGKFIVEVDGRPWTVDAERLDGRSLSLLIEEVRQSEGAARPGSEGAGRMLSREVTIVPDSSGQLAVTAGPSTVLLSVNGRRRAGRAASDGHSGGGPQRLVAPMPGKVVRVLVRAGDEVLTRQGIVVIEAMKMENELRAGRDGVVAEVHVKEGQSVDAGALLVVIGKRSG